MKNLDAVNEHFDKFIRQIKDVRKNVEKEDNYSKGYLACMKDVIDGISSGDLPEWMNHVEIINDMKNRKEVIDEILSGLDGLLEAYKNKVGD
tara:strand:- start:578 stop:853 length:276 start_codon:yes stop_codon:yes gene_type:complete